MFTKNIILNTEEMMNKTTEKKRLVLIGIRRKGESGFKIKTINTRESSLKIRTPVSLTMSTSLAS